MSLQDATSRSLALFNAGRHAAAADLLEGQLVANPGDGALRVNLGLCFQRMRDFSRAEALYREAIVLEPGRVEAWSWLGDLLREAGRPDEAHAAVMRAIELGADRAAPHAVLGLLMQQFGKVGEAVVAFRAALAREPDSPETWCNLGVALQDAGSIGDAQAAYRRALAIDPRHQAAWSDLLMGMQYDPAASARQLREAAEEWARTTAALPRYAIGPARRGGRLRIGYVSADFYRHPVGWFFTPVAQAHDRSRFEVFCYANQSRNDDVTTGIATAVEHWRDVRMLDDQALCEMIRDDGIDVLVDLSGHTAGNRLGVFARKPAPLQFSWLGYFASTGLATMDGAIFGAGQIAPGADTYFVEPVERLERNQFCYAPPSYAPAVAERPAVAGGAVVFGSFGNASKINDEVLGAWAKVLQAMPGSRLLLKWKTFADAGVRVSLGRAFHRCGGDPERIELRGPTEHAAMLAEYGDIDIALDTWPFSGALTTCEALWMGVPVITLEWLRPVSRQTSALLRTLGLDELVADTPEDYVRLAVMLAGDQARRARLRAGMRHIMRSSALMDGPSMARALEAAYLRHATRRWSA